MARTKLPSNTKRDRKPTANTPAKPLDKVDHAQKMTWKHGIVATVAARFLPKPPKPAPGRSSTSPIIDDGGFQPVFGTSLTEGPSDSAACTAAAIRTARLSASDAEDHKPTQ